MRSLFPGTRTTSKHAVVSQRKAVGVFSLLPGLVLVFIFITHNIVKRTIATRYTCLVSCYDTTSHHLYACLDNICIANTTWYYLLLLMAAVLVDFHRFFCRPALWYFRRRKSLTRVTKSYLLAMMAAQKDSSSSRSTVIVRGCCKGQGKMP